MSKIKINKTIFVEMLSANFVFLIIASLIMEDEYPDMDWFAIPVIIILGVSWIIINYFLWLWIRGNPINPRK